MNTTCRILAICATALTLLRADLQTIKNEPNPEKRVHLALAYADNALTEARYSYRDGDTRGTELKLAQVQQAVELAQSALSSSGKKPGRSPGPFKYAETKSRELLRRIHSLKDEMDASDRGMIEPVQNKVQEIHDAWLDGILTHAK